MYSIIIANDIRHLIKELADKLDVNDKAVEATKELGIENIVKNLVQASSDLIFSVVDDAYTIEISK